MMRKEERGWRCWVDRTVEPPSSLRVRLSDVRERMEWKARARCGDKRQRCDRTIERFAWLNAELQTNWATAALLFLS